MIMPSSIFFGCAVCFGDPNSLSSKALTLGIFLLFGVIAFVLSCIAWTAFSWARREKKMNAASE